MLNKITNAEKERVQKMYDCEENPLVYQITPSGTFDVIESRKITFKDFED